MSPENLPISKTVSFTVKPANPLGERVSTPESNTFRLSLSYPQRRDKEDKEELQQFSPLSPKSAQVSQVCPSLPLSPPSPNCWIRPSQTLDYHSGDRIGDAEFPSAPLCPLPLTGFSWMSGLTPRLALGVFCYRLWLL